MIYARVRVCAAQLDSSDLYTCARLYVCMAQVDKSEELDEHAFRLKSR